MGRRTADSVAARGPGNSRSVSAMRSETTPGNIRKSAASTVRALSVSAAMAKRPCAKPAAKRATSAKRAYLMRATPAQAASTTQPRTHQPIVSPRLSTIRIAIRPRERRVAVIAVLTTLSYSYSAFNLARELVGLKLAACANVLAPATSFYRWEGRDEQASEYPVLI